MDWDAFAQRRKSVIKARGEWVGLLDENGEPVCECPPYELMKDPTTRLNPESFEAKFRVDIGGVAHQIVDELVADGLGRQDERLRLVPVMGPPRFVMVERESWRAVYRVQLTKAECDARLPHSLTVHGTDMLSELMLLPGWSAPGQVKGEFALQDSDLGARYEKPRMYAPVKMAVVADGFTFDGPADQVIRRMIRESLKATYGLFGVEDYPIVVADTSTGKPSKRLLLRPSDNSLWDEISTPAQMSGCVVKAHMWLPGDKPVAGLDLAKPSIVVEVLQQ
ncbi:hypothetical protein [Corynebacterium silvaticum]|uniref:Uncharacterized protein n=2 Tax=Corynebacterium silvaticum TaxID=2320431 RepID=A0A7Y4P7S2_9CORY|nr:hypothetical protein [Corynebacterium silvaticum]ARU46719.1 hypothetical protein CBE74_09960 [Corynebacterium silvaticum]NON70018.1 hypothetical protein [Corynebacterium silvaticum]UWG99957.1 hypothetical protein K1I39_09880 [Corynebacterium silvaticum]UWH02001.1 hypothetical protein K1I38_09895 [Corynebacterium silvaticum]UWH04038.1 hypothetical protein K1I36_09900 [Corynebacterium silvaticum]